MTFPCRTSLLPRCRHRRLPTWLATGLLFALLLASGAESSVFKYSGVYELSSLERIDDDLYYFGQRAVVSGIVTGDFSGFANNLRIEGEIQQSANLFGQSIEHNGVVNGALRAFGQDIIVSGYINRSLLAFGANLQIRQGATIQGDLHAMGGKVNLAGTVMGEVVLRGDYVEISGTLIEPVSVTAERVRIVSPASLAAGITYVSANEIEIDSTGGVTINGPVTWRLPEDEKEEDDAKAAFRGMVLEVSSLLAAFLFGLLLVYLFRPYAEATVEQLRERTAVSAAAGVLGIVLLALTVITLVLVLVTSIIGYVLSSGDLAPIGAVILVLSIVLLPVTAFLSLTGAIMLYCGKIAVAFLIGYWIMHKARPGAALLARGGLFVGLIILTLLFLLPGIGCLLEILTRIVGLGAILLGIRYCRQKMQKPAPPTESSNT